MNPPQHDYDVRSDSYEPDARCTTRLCPVMPSSLAQNAGYSTKYCFLILYHASNASRPVVPDPTRTSTEPSSSTHLPGSETYSLNPAFWRSRNIITSSG